MTAATPERTSTKPAVAGPRPYAIVGFKFKHHNDDSGYVQITKFIDADYINLEEPIVTRNLRGIPTGPFTRYIADEIAGRRCKGRSVVHFFYPENHLARADKIVRPAKVVVTVHHPFQWYTSPDPALGWKRVKLVRALDKALHRVDAIILLEPTEVPLFQAEYKQAMVEFIPRGVVDFSRFFAEPDPGERKLELVMTGINYRDWDAVEAVLAYMKDHEPNWKLHFVGGRQHAKALAEKYPQAIAHGWLTQDQYLGLLAKADFNFLPLTYATSNNALVEAHAVGTPTLITNLASVGPYCLGSTLRFNDGPDAVRLLKELAADPGRRAALREQTRREATKFHWASLARQVEDLYRRVEAAR